MNKLILTLLLVASSTTAVASDYDYDSETITCDIVDHSLYSQTIVDGFTSIDFVRKDGKNSSVYHDGYLFKVDEIGVTAVYHDGDHELFYMDHKKLDGLVRIPTVDDDAGVDAESGLYVIENCKLGKPEESN